MTINTQTKIMLDSLNINTFQDWIDLNKNHEERTKSVQALIQAIRKDFSISEYLSGETIVMKPITTLDNQKIELFMKIEDMTPKEIFFYFVEKVGTYNKETQEIILPDTCITSYSYLKGQDLVLKFIDDTLVGQGCNGDVVIKDLDKLYNELIFPIYFNLFSDENNHVLMKHGDLTSTLALDLLTTKITIHYPN